MRVPTRLLCVSALSLLLLYPPARADGPSGVDEESPPIEVLEADPVFEPPNPKTPPSAVLVAKRREPVGEAPGSVSVLSEPLLEDHGAHRLGDALAWVPGFIAQTELGAFDVFSVRGFSSPDDAAVLVDGTLETGGIFLPLYNVERLEVGRGPFGSLQGAGPLAGAVHLVRKRPMRGTRLRIGYGYGSHATQEWALDINHGRPDNGAGWRINALWQVADGFRDDTPSAVTAVHPVYAFRLGRRTAVVLSLEALRADFTPDAGLPLLPSGALPEVSRGRSFAAASDLSNRDLLRLQIDTETVLSSALTLRSRTYLKTLDVEQQATLLHGVFDSPTGEDELFVRRARALEDGRRRLAGQQIEALWESASGGATQHRLLAGIEWTRRRDTSRRAVAELASAEIFAPRPSAEFSDAPIGPLERSLDDLTADTIAPYLLEDLQIGQAWRLRIGGRFEVVEIDDAAVDDHFQGDHCQGDHFQGERFLPFLGVSWMPSDALHLYAAYSEGSSVPSPRAVVHGLLRRPDALRPAETEQIELGWKGSFADGRLRAAVALYRLEKDRVPFAVADPDGPLGLGLGVGAQRSEGLELELAWRPGRHLDAALTYAWTDAVLTDPARRHAPFAPEHLLGLWVRSKLSERFRLAVGGRWIAAQWIAPDSPHRIDDAFLVDASLIWSRYRWRAAVELRNLTDENTAGRGFAAETVLPSDGFNIFANVRIDL